MNLRMILYTVGQIIRLEAALLLLPLAVALPSTVYGRVMRAGSVNTAILAPVFSRGAVCPVYSILTQPQKIAVKMATAKILFITTP